MELLFPTACQEKPVLWNGGEPHHTHLGLHLNQDVVVGVLYTLHTPAFRLAVCGVKNFCTQSVGYLI